MSDISYLIIYNAHNGDSMKIPKPIRFHNLQEFKRFLSQSFLLESVDNIFLLTSFGIKLKFSLINELVDIYVFDKRLFNTFDSKILNHYTVANAPKASNGAAIDHEPQPSMLTTSDDYDANGHHIQQITHALKQNQGWAQRCVGQCLTWEHQAKELINHINIMFKSLNTIFQFATNFINDVEKTFNNYFSYIKLINYKTLHKSWKDHYHKLSKFPAIKIKHKSINLMELLDYNQLLTQSDYIEQFLPLVVEEFNAMSHTINSIGEEKLNVDKQIESLRNQSITEFKPVNLAQVCQDINSTSRLILNDYETLTTSDTNLFEIYKAHKNVLCPKIYKDSVILFNHYKGLNQFKLTLIHESVKVFNKIATLQMNLFPIKTYLASLTDTHLSNPESNSATTSSSGNGNGTTKAISYQTIQSIKKCEDYLALTIDLPLLFGFILIEKRRQYEWYDFFSKGIVNNVSEQITTIIDHEKLFRKIWIKKFGNILPLLNDDNGNSNLPNFDITLLGNNRSSPSLSFTILNDLIIDRDDILSYISLLNSNVSDNFIELLNKNFKDLIKSTNTMKKITKIISSLGTQTSLAEQQEQGQEVDDIDLNLIKGLKSRIKKLENLLHQQQYKNLTSWPVTRNNHNLIEESNSVIVTPGSQKNHNNGNNTTMINNHRSSLMINPSTMPKLDPTQLLSRRNSTNSRTSTTLNESTNNIDKHLDNIRLKRENQDLMVENERLMEENQAYKNEVQALQQKIELLTQQNSDKDNEIKLNNKMDLKEIDSLNKKIDLRDIKISELQNNYNKISELNSNIGGEVNRLNQTITGLRNELNESTQTKNDLLSKLASAEFEITKQKNVFDDDVRRLQAKIDDIRQNCESLVDLSNKDKKVKVVLENIIINLFGHINKLSHELFDSFLEFCFILESMGLLLSKDDNNMYKIIRVRGLRSKKNVVVDEGDTSLISIEKPSSRVIDDIGNKMNWLDDLKDLKLTSSPEIDQTNDLIKFYDDNLEHDTENGTSNLDDFISSISFKENVLMQEDSINNTKFFLNAIAKRFKDVEGFAKRQTKDSKIKDQEISKLFHKLNSKISMNGFQVNDLVLFLPTRIERANNEQEGENSQQLQRHPWAAFNIGAPHYFLKVTNESQTQDKEWMVGRVLSITEHKVDDENASSQDLNPFQLSVGVVWHLVEAKEQFA